MADRSGDDLHAMDTRQELMSLSARFGLTVTFQQPDKDRYDRILLELAKQYNVQMPSDQLFIKGCRLCPARRWPQPARSQAVCGAAGGGRQGIKFLHPVVVNNVRHYIA